MIKLTDWNVLLFADSGRYFVELWCV